MYRPLLLIEVMLYLTYVGLYISLCILHQGSTYMENVGSLLIVCALSLYISSTYVCSRRVLYIYKYIYTYILHVCTALCFYTYIYIYISSTCVCSRCVLYIYTHIYIHISSTYVGRSISIHMLT